MTDESGQTLPVHDRHAARPRARPRGLLRRVHRQHAHRRGQRHAAAWSADDRRVGAGARRAGRLGAPDARPGSTAATPRPSATPTWNGQDLAFSVTPGARRAQPARAASGERGSTHARDADARRVARRVQRRDGRGARATRSSPPRAGATSRAYLRRHDAAGDLGARRAPSRASPAAAKIRWTTDEPATSHVVYGTSPAASRSRSPRPARDGAPADARRSRRPGRPIYYRVSSADAVGQLRDDARAAGAPASFTIGIAACLHDERRPTSPLARTPARMTDVGVQPGLAPRRSPSTARRSRRTGASTAVVGRRFGRGRGRRRSFVDGARVGSDASTRPGRTLEFTATFSRRGASSTSASASTTTAAVGDLQHRRRRPSLKARTHNGAASLESDLGLGAWARRTSSASVEPDRRCSTTSTARWSRRTRSRSRRPCAPLVSDVNPGGTGPHGRLAAHDRPTRRRAASPRASPTPGHASSWGAAPGRARRRPGPASRCSCAPARRRVRTARGAPSRHRVVGSPRPGRPLRAVPRGSLRRAIPTRRRVLQSVRSRVPPPRSAATACSTAPSSATTANTLHGRRLLRDLRVRGPGRRRRRHPERVRDRHGHLRLAHQHRQQSARCRQRRRRRCATAPRSRPATNPLDGRPRRRWLLRRTVRARDAPARARPATTAG